jgi:hypothetical protein
LLNKYGRYACKKHGGKRRGAHFEMIPLPSHAGRCGLWSAGRVCAAKPFA